MFNDRILVIDEMHLSRNHKAARTQSCLAVCRAGRRVIAMTGTPVYNKPDDLWTILCGIRRNRDIAGSKADFRASYVDNNNLVELNTRLAASGAFIRRLKKDVLTELPPKTWQDYILEMSPRQSAEYESVRNGLKAHVKAGSPASASHGTLAMLTNLQTIANRAKVEPIAEALIERHESGQYSVVVSERLEPLLEIQGKCQEEGMIVEVIHGGSSNFDRMRICNDFNSGTCHAVLTTLSEGINLVKADALYVLDMPWTWAKLTQKIDRSHRIGQMNSLMVVRVIAASIDSHKVAVVTQKKELSDQILDAGDSPTSEDANVAEVTRRLVDEA
jgi:SNF2 family DNA or RNA helicase